MTQELVIKIFGEQGTARKTRIALEKYGYNLTEQEIVGIVTKSRDFPPVGEASGRTTRSVPQVS